MTDSIDSLLEAARAEVRGGATPEQVVQFLRGAEATGLEATKIVKLLYGSTLAEANAIVATDPEWARMQRDCDETLQDAFDQVLGEDGP